MFKRNVVLAVAGQTEETAVSRLSLPALFGALLVSLVFVLVTAGSALGMSHAAKPLAGPLNLVAAPFDGPTGQSGVAPSLSHTPPTVTKVEPSEGPSSGGTAVTITGTGFTEGAIVKIGAEATEVVVKSETEITAKTAATAVGKDEVSVLDSKGLSTGGPDFTFLAPPKVTSVAPAEGSTAGGGAVKLVGTGFVSGAKVKIGSEATEVEVKSATEILAKTAAHAAGKQEVVVVDADGTSSAGPDYTFITPPTVTSISPKEGTTAGGTTVKVKGTGFLKGAKVKIGGEAASVTVVSETELTAKTAAHAAGKAEVEITENGVSQSETVEYTFATPPHVTKVEAAEGTTAGGTAVKITGTGFAEGAKVSIGGEATEVVVKSATEITAKTAAHAAGKVEVLVTNGEVASVGGASYTFFVPPTVTSVSPKVGTTAGGTLVKIKGTGFLAGAKVKIGGEATSVTFVSATEITAKTAATEAGEDEVEVTEASVAQSASVKFKFEVPPTVTKVEPSEGPSSGGTAVTITGTGFAEGAKVKIGAEATEVVVKSETEITAKTAASTIGKAEVVVSNGEVSSTGGPDFTFLAPPKVSGVTPAEGSTAGGAAVKIAGTGFVSGAKVKIGSEATEVEVKSATEILAKTAAHAAGKQEVVVVDADGTSSSGPGYTFITPPTVTSISPKEGTTAGGTTVKVKGTGFLKGAKVKIGGEAASVTVVSGTELTAKTAAHAAGKAEVEVTENGVSQSETIEYTFAAPAKVTKIEAAEGTTAGGTAVKITGTGFAEGAKVSIGGEATEVEVKSETEIKAKTPAHAAGKVEVVVTNGEVASVGGASYTFFVPPTVTSVSPKEGTTAGGTLVKIKGTGFQAGAKVKIGGEATSVTFVSATEITAKTAATEAGEDEVEVTEASVPQSASVKFKFETPATVTKVEPSEGPSSGGTAVTITGTGFTEGAKVKIGSAATEVVVKSETEITAKTAASTIGKAEVVVTNGEVSSTGGPDFTYLAPPKVSGVTPAEGSTAGGAAVKVVGTGFVSGAKVKIGSEATEVEVKSATEILAKTAAHAAGKQEVVVVDADGTSSAGPDYTFITPPTVTSISPKEGTTAGGTTVKVKGTGFLKGAKVKIGGEAASVTVVSETELTAKTAAHAAGKAEVEITENGVSQSETVEYTFATPPHVTKVEAAEGTTAGGTAVKITGTGFAEGAKVSIGGEATEVVVKSATEITAKTAAHAAGKVEVLVTNGEVASVGGASYTFFVPPTVTSVSPKVGTTAGGTLVKIKGTGFLAGAKVKIGGEATSVTFVSATEITAKTAATEAGEDEVEVTEASVAQSASVKFKFEVPPTVTKVEPSEGPSSGGTAVTITGTGFAEGAKVKIGAEATEVVVKSETEITAKTAASTIGKAEVVVSNGEVSSTGGPDFTFLAPPKVSGVTPAEGSTAGGAAVKIAGTGFVSGAKVKIGSEATEVEVKSATEILAKTAAHAAGKQEVVVVDADGTSSSGPGYTFITPPTVTSISPKEGTTAGGTTVKVKGTGFLKGAKVKIGGEAASVTVVSGTELTAKTAAHAAGKAEVEVTENGVSQSETIEYTFAAPAKVTKIEAAEGTTAGGTAVKITGTGFAEGAKVSIGGEATEVEVKSETEIKAKTPAHAAGKVEVVVTNGEVASVGGASYTFFVPPTVTSVSPKEGTTAGGTLVKIKGTGFQAGAKVKIGGEATSVTFVSATEITAKTAATEAGEDEVEVTEASVPQSASVKFKFETPATVTKVEPSEGPSSGGTAVTITGTGFTEGAKVKIGSAATEVVVKSETEITAKTAASTIGKAEVIVTNGEVSSTGGPDFTYLAPPKVTSVAPAEGSTAGGGAVKLVGTGFVSGAKVKIGSEATEVEVKSATEILAKTAAHAAGKQEVVVVDADGTSSAGPDYTFITPPTVTSISPKEGTTAGGTTVKVKGTGFLKGAKVKIGGEAASVTVVSETELTAKTAAHAAGKAEVEITENGVSQSETVEYTFATPPHVTSISPPEGSHLGGWEVAIKGTGFTEGSKVTIGSEVAELEYVSATELYAKTAAHAAGKVEVVVTNGEVSSIAGPLYTYL